MKNTANVAEPMSKRVLELKDISPYLPYRLQVKQLNYKSNYNGNEFGCLTGFYPLYVNEIPSWQFITDNNPTGQSLEDMKPLLRPMSSLLDDFEQEGRILNIRNEIKELTSDIFYLDTTTSSKIITLFRKNKDGGTSVCFLYEAFVSQAPLWLTNLLFKHHFDVFDLIGDGLAIPLVNTEQNSTPI